MTLKATVLLLSAVVVVFAIPDNNRIVLFPKHKSGVLVCYKDRRTDGGAFWSYADERQRRPHVYHCPSSLSAWCVSVATGELSVRGCSGPTGVNKAGCFHVVDNDQNVTSKVCLCNRDYCNAASVGGQAVPPLLVLIVAAANY